MQSGRKRPKYKDRDRETMYMSNLGLVTCTYVLDTAEYTVKNTYTDLRQSSYTGTDRAVVRTREIKQRGSSQLVHCVEQVYVG